jgi:hypothetical protein
MSFDPANDDDNDFNEFDLNGDGEERPESPLAFATLPELIEELAHRCDALLLNLRVDRGDDRERRLLVCKGEATHIAGMAAEAATQASLASLQLFDGRTDQDDVEPENEPG